MIVYQGVDIVEISKLTRVVCKNSDFISDIFTPAESEYCLSKKNPYPHFAGRFAAKEASFKALGLGMSGVGISHSFQEVEILSSKSGKPSITLNGWLAKISEKKKIRQLTVSISHAADYAVASVIMTGQDRVS